MPDTWGRRRHAYSGFLLDCYSNPVTWWRSKIVWRRTLIKALAFGWRIVIVLKIILAIIYYATHISPMA